MREFFTGGNTLVRVGIVILFFGIAFLLRYAAEHTNVPIELRLLGVALGAIALLALGWYLRQRRPGFALALQGGGVGILYLTLFAALRLYALLSPGMAFVALVAIAAFAAVLAVLQNSMAFAVLAAVGGFLAPILASTGQGDHVTLFGYYAILNAGILAVAWFKAWRPLNVVGFGFTFGIGIVWGVLRYRADLFVSTEPFLVLFFLMYVAIAVLFALRQPPQLRGYVDGTIVFGTPLVAFGLQAGMLHDHPYALAFSALAVSTLYLTLAWLLHLRQATTQRLLVEAFMALGVVFLTLAVPLALEARWSAATWALEGAALVWIGCRQDRRLPRVFGVLLQAAAGVIFWDQAAGSRGGLPVLNSACLGALTIAVGSMFCARLLYAARDRLAAYEGWFSTALFFWALLWWLLAGLLEIDRHVPQPYPAAAALLFMTVTALLSSELHRRLHMDIARLPALWLLPMLALFAALAVDAVPHPFADGGWVAWPLAFAAFYLICRRHEGEPDEWLATLLHTASAWLLLGMAGWEVGWGIDALVAGGGSWPAIGWVLLPAAALLLLPELTQRLTWPVAAHRETYGGFAAAGVAVYVLLWSLATNVLMPGDPAPLPYIPLLNPLDLAQSLVLIALLRLWSHSRSPHGSAWIGDHAPVLLWAIAAMMFIWLNAVLLRTLHHWAAVPYELEALARSTLVQMAISIFWAVLALTTMLIATRRTNRLVWLVGAGLLAATIAKLFLIDLSRIGTVERIVSFVGVGLLMLVIGYFSPLPPALKAQQR